MAVIDTLAKFAREPNQALMQDTQYATSAWQNLVEGLKTKRVGDEILDVFKQKKGQVEPADLAGIAQKYHMTLPEFGKAIDLLTKSGALELERAKIKLAKTQTTRAQNIPVAAGTGLYNIGTGKTTTPIPKATKKIVMYTSDGTSLTVPNTQIADYKSQGLMTQNDVKTAFTTNLNMIRGYMPAEAQSAVDKIAKTGLSPADIQAMLNSSTLRTSLLQTLQKIYKEGDNAAKSAADKVLQYGKTLKAFDDDFIQAVKGQGTAPGTPAAGSINLQELIKQHTETTGGW